MPISGRQVAEMRNPQLRPVPPVPVIGRHLGQGSAHVLTLVVGAMSGSEVGQATGDLGVVHAGALYVDQHDSKTARRVVLRRAEECQYVRRGRLRPAGSP